MAIRRIVCTEMKPEIALITPVWNGMPYVVECVESVLKQSFQNWEMVIGDNGSTDGTREYLATLKDPRIRVFFHDMNQGIFGNLNLLFKEAKAEVSQILCADDYFFPNGLVELVETWRRLPEAIGSLRSSFQPMRESACRLNRYFMQLGLKSVSPKNADLMFFIFGNFPGNLSNVSVKTKLVEELGGFDPTLPFAGDFDFWLRLTRIAPMSLEGSECIFVRRHAGVASNYLNTKGELSKQTSVVVTSIFEKLKQQFPKWLLRVHGTLNYDVLARYTGLKKGIRTGNWENIRTIDESSRNATYCFAPFVGWLVLFLSGAGHWGRVTVAKQLLHKGQCEDMPNSFDLSDRLADAKTGC